MSEKPAALENSKQLEMAAKLETDAATTLAARLRLLRENSDLSNLEIAQKCGVSATTFSAYVRGAAVPPGTRLAVIAKILGTTPNYLLGFTDKQIDVTQRERAILELYRQLDTDGRETVYDVLCEQVRESLLSLDDGSDAVTRNAKKTPASGRRSRKK